MRTYEEIQNIIFSKLRIRPSQAQIGKILGLYQSAISGRIKRNSYFKMDELQKIEQFFNITGLTSVNVINNLSKETFSCFSDIQLLKAKKVIDEILQERIEQI